MDKVPFKYAKKVENPEILHGIPTNKSIFTCQMIPEMSEDDQTKKHKAGIFLISFLRQTTAPGQSRMN